METGEVGELAIRTRDEVGFLAEAFHSMVSTLIYEKRTISAQLEQISVLHANNESIMNSIRAGIIVMDTEGTVEFCNSYFIDLVGLGFAALRGRSVREVLEQSFVFASPLPPTLSYGQDGRMEGLRRDHPGSEPQNFTLKVSPLPLTGGRIGSLVVLEDITASERFWARMTVADKITSLGVLSAGVAHEINNPLGSILSHVSYLKAVEHEKDKLDSLTWIETETNRIATLIRRIRAYSAPETSAAHSADLNAVAGATVDALRFLVAKRELHLFVELSENVGAVSCPTDELKQVALNILLNAVEACTNGGSITVRTSAEDKGRAVLAVTDDGAGIEPEHMKHIFDPFFSTKSAGLGSGLGLSICWAIVTRSGGEIRVRSTPGKGTTVEVVLSARERTNR
jgi:PAS domain S-box-containing protein